MTVVIVHEAKTNLSKLLKLVEAGEEVVIVQGMVPEARLLPMEPVKPKTRGFGSLKGKVGSLPDFLEHLTAEELALWVGGPVEPAP